MSHLSSPFKEAFLIYKDNIHKNKQIQPLKKCAQGSVMHSTWVYRSPLILLHRKLISTAMQSEISEKNTERQRVPKINTAKLSIGPSVMCLKMNDYQKYVPHHSVWWWTHIEPSGGFRAETCSLKDKKAGDATSLGLNQVSASYFFGCLFKRNYNTHTSYHTACSRY
jgi:hypothetical protein